jgi:hypothetical protein
MVHFPVSGVEVNPWLFRSLAFLMLTLSAPAGVECVPAFALLAERARLKQPGLSPTNLQNVVATPEGVFTDACGRGGWRGWCLSVSGSRAAKRSLMGSMKYDWIARLDTRLHLGKLQRLPG